MSQNIFCVVQKKVSLELHEGESIMTKFIFRQTIALKGLFTQK